MLGLDEGDPPLAVEVHRDLADLEGVRRRELVTETGLEPTRFLYPYQSISAFCHLSHFAQPGCCASIASPWRRSTCSEEVTQRSGTFS